MAYQTSKGNAAPATGMPGPTPPPTKFANPSLNERDFQPGYGTNHFTGASSADPGQKVTSPLADDLKAKAAQGDGGDLLQDIVTRGTARDTSVELQSPQTRTVDNTPLPTTFGMRSRNGENATVPAKTGQAVFDPNSERKPG